jgi:hypothetical protein
VNYKVGSSDSLQIEVRDSWLSGTNLFVMVHLSTESKLIKVDLGGPTQYIIDIPSSAGSNF